MPRTHEEIELLSGLAAVARLHMHDETGVRCHPLHYAAVTEQRRNELIEEQRLTDAHLDRHPAPLSAAGTADPRDDRLVKFGRSAGSVARAGNESTVMRNLVDLASRRDGGIEVALIWNRTDSSLVVFAHDDRTDEDVAIPVSADEAAEVYRHPFAYAHRSLEAGEGRAAHALPRTR